LSESKIKLPVLTEIGGRRICEILV